MFHQHNALESLSTIVGEPSKYYLAITLYNLIPIYAIEIGCCINIRLSHRLVN
jgi:hypothetical protein